MHIHQVTSQRNKKGLTSKGFSSIHLYLCFDRTSKKMRSHLMLVAFTRMKVLLIQLFFSKYKYYKFLKIYCCTHTQNVNQKNLCDRIAFSSKQVVCPFRYLIFHILCQSIRILESDAIIPIPRNMFLGNINIYININGSHEFQTQYSMLRCVNKTLI